MRRRTGRAAPTEDPEPPRRVLRLRADIEAEEAAGRAFAEMLALVQASAPPGLTTSKARPKA